MPDISPTFLLESCNRQISDQPACRQTDQSTSSPEKTKHVWENMFPSVTNILTGNKKNNIKHRVSKCCSCMDTKLVWHHKHTILRWRDGSWCCFSITLDHPVRAPSLSLPQPLFHHRGTASWIWSGRSEHCRCTNPGGTAHTCRG